MISGLTRQIVLFPGSFPSVPSESTTSPAEDTFEKIQSLAGVWEGKDDLGMVAKTTFKVIAAKTAVIETLDMSGTERMVALYSLHGGAISLIHYSTTNNQPRMEASPPSGPIQELVFEFKDARNLFSLTARRVQKLILRFHDADHISETWTWRLDGRDSPKTYVLARRKHESLPAKLRGSMSQAAMQVQDG
jgi:hypothetical protein